MTETQTQTATSSASSKSPIATFHLWGFVGISDQTEPGQIVSALSGPERVKNVAIAKASKTTNPEFTHAIDIAFEEVDNFHFHGSWLDIAVTKIKNLFSDSIWGCGKELPSSNSPFHSGFHHTLFWKWKDGISPEKIDHVLLGQIGKLLSLDMVLFINSGRLLNQPHGWTHFSNIVLKNEESLAIYAANDAHQRCLKNDIIPIKAGRLCLDYTLEFSL